MSVNWDNVNSLLSVIHGSASAGPKYTYITARAEALLHKHMQDNPEVQAVPPETPVTAPPVALSAVPQEQEPEPAPPSSEPPSGDGTPGPDATAPTAVDRRV